MAKPLVIFEMANNHMGDVAHGEAVVRAFAAVAQEGGFLTACTPFDEPSVDRIEAKGIAIVKIASRSFTDWPLLGRMRCVGRMGGHYAG